MFPKYCQPSAFLACCQPLIYVDGFRQFAQYYRLFKRQRNVISQVLTNSGTTIETVSYQVTPTSEQLCRNIIIHHRDGKPKPMVTTTPLAKTLCSGS